MKSTGKKVTVIGGGITGLAAALRLTRRAKEEGRDLEVELLESSSRLGGSLHSTRRDGFLLEGGPDCFISNKARGVKLCEELGLFDQLINTRPEFRRSFIVKNGKLHPVPEGFYLLAPAKLHPFLMSPLLSWPGKLRTLLEPLVPAKPQDEESLASFVRRRLGREVLDWLAQPLVAGIYAADPETLSLRSTFPLFIEMEKKYGSILLGLAKRDSAVQSASGARYSLFVSFRNGMETFVSRIAALLPQESVRRNTPVQHIQRSEQGWDIHLKNGERSHSDAICLCTGAPQSARLLELQNRALSAELSSIPYTHSMTVNLAFDAGLIRHPMDGVGFVTPELEAHRHSFEMEEETAPRRDGGRPAIACTFVHRKFAGRAPEGTALLRAFLGGAHQADLLAKDDQALTNIVLDQVGRLLGISGPPKFTSVERWPDAMPQYTLGHLPRMLKIEEAAFGLPGLALAGNWQYGAGVPDCIESGERAADALVDRFLRLEPAAHSPR